METKILIAIIAACGSVIVALISLITSIINSLAAKKAAIMSSLIAEKTTHSLEILKHELMRQSKTKEIYDEEFKNTIIGLRDAIENIQGFKDELFRTIHSKQESLFADEAKKRGVISLEAPVSNLSHMGADFANTSIYVGGEQEAYDRVKEVLKVISKISFHVAKIGEAQTVKLITNLLYYTDTVICGECLAIAQEAGIPLQWMWEQINNSTAFSVSTEQFMPFLFDHTYDNSCSLEIGHKDMNLTTDLADELKVALPLGRIIRDHFNEAMRRWGGQDKHVIVCKVTEEDNNISMQIPGFVAPSKYGANPDYIRSGEMVTDEYGRIKPKLPDSYKADAFEPTPEQQALIQTLIEYMTWINYVIYEDKN